MDMPYGACRISSPNKFHLSGLAGEETQNRRADRAWSCYLRNDTDSLLRIRALNREAHVHIDPSGRAANPSGRAAGNRKKRGSRRSPPTRSTRVEVSTGEQRALPPPGVGAPPPSCPGRSCSYRCAADEMSAPASGRKRRGVSPTGLVLAKISEQLVPAVALSHDLIITLRPAPARPAARRAASPARRSPDRARAGSAAGRRRR